MNRTMAYKITGIVLLLILLAYVVSLVELYSQIGRYRNYWNNNNQRTAQPNEISYIALGDSTAQSIGASSPARGYVGVIAKELSNHRGQPVHTVNLSTTGAKISDALDSQLPALQKMTVTPKTVLTIEIGANDMISFEPVRFEREMDKLMSQLPPQTLITDMPYFGESRLRRMEPNVEKANQIMYQLASKHGFKLLPLHERIKQNGGIKTFAPDWFHPSNIAYRENWATVFLDRPR